jgi:hypothetical protein
MPDPGQGFPEVTLGRGLVGLGKGEPADRGAVVLRAGRVWHLGGQDESDVGVLVGRLALAWGDADDDQVTDLGVRLRRQVGQAGLLLRFPSGDGERVGLSLVAVATYL